MRNKFLFFIMILTVFFMISTLGFAKKYSDTSGPGSGQGVSTVGISGDYASLYEASLDFNTTDNTGSWTLNILNSLSEDSNICFGNIVLSTSTVTIKPDASLSGIGATISFTTTTTDGTNQQSGAINIGAKILTSQAQFTSVQNFIIDGSATSGTTRDLTIQNTSGLGNQVRDVLSVYGPASTIVFKNLNIINNQANGAGTALTHGINIRAYVRSDNTGFWSDSVTIENCYIVSSSSIASQGIQFTYTGPGTPPIGLSHRNAVMTNNHIVVRHRGVHVNRANDLTFSYNTVEVNQTDPGFTSSGYNHINSLMIGTTKIFGNVFSKLSTAATAASHGIYGMNLSPGSGATDFWIYNNHITGFGFYTPPAVSNVNYTGILADTAPSGCSYNILHNSINMVQQSTLAQTVTSGINLVVTSPTGIRTIKNNIIRMDQPGGVCVRLGGVSSSGAGGNMDHNNWFTSASTGRIGSTYYETLGDWTTALANGSDLNSQSVDPTATSPASWISATDLRFSAGDAYPMAWGTNDLTPAPFTVTTDIDGNTRSATKPWPGSAEGTMELTVPVELSDFSIE